MLRNSVSQELRSGRTFSAHLSEGGENITLLRNDNSMIIEF